MKLLRHKPGVRDGIPWCKAYEHFLRNPNISPTAKTLLVLLKSFGNPDGSNCHPSIARLAFHLNTDEATTKKYLKELTTKDLLRRERRTGKGGKRTTDLFVLLDDAHHTVGTNFTPYPRVQKTPPPLGQNSGGKKHTPTKSTTKNTFPHVNGGNGHSNESKEPTPVFR